MAELSGRKIAETGVLLRNRMPEHTLISTQDSHSVSVATSQIDRFDD